jgi:hypothetical protein
MTAAHDVGFLRGVDRPRFVRAWAFAGLRGTPGHRHSIQRAGDLLHAGSGSLHTLEESS